MTEASPDTKSGWTTAGSKSIAIRPSSMPSRLTCTGERVPSALWMAALEALNAAQADSPTPRSRSNNA